MGNTISTAALQRLLGVGKPALSELAVRGIVHRGEKRGTYLLEGFVRRTQPHRPPANAHP
jgi:hypothetical protein